jgi:integrase
MQGWCEQLARECLAKHGLIVDDESQLKLAKAIGAAVQRASLVLARFAEGDFSQVEPPGLLSAAGKSIPARPTEPPLPIDILIQGWAAERRPTEKTIYEWSRVMRQLAAFVGHDDARRLTPDDLVNWKQALVAAGLRPKTIRDAKLAPARSILQWAVDNRLLQANSAERISIDVKTRASESKRTFSDEEAAIVLKAALAAKDPVKRWVPWLCAYSGARLSELCQLRREDIVHLDGIWAMKIDPEAGSLKTHSAERVVPLHPAILDCGFLAFVERANPGPLFPDLPPDRFGSRGGNGTKVLGRWVRALGLEDSRLSPNHSWRHRLKTLGGRHALAPDIVSAIVGHARKSVADRYGEFPIAALYRELCKIPAIALPPD